MSITINPVLNTVGNDPESERLYRSDGLVARFTICHYPGQIAYLGDPSAIRLLLYFDVVLHISNIAHSRNKASGSNCMRSGEDAWCLVEFFNHRM